MNQEAEKVRTWLFDKWLTQPEHGATAGFYGGAIDTIGVHMARIYMKNGLQWSVGSYGIHTTGGLYGEGISHDEALFFGETMAFLHGVMATIHEAWGEEEATQTLKALLVLFRSVWERDAIQCGFPIEELPNSVLPPPPEV
jgi:hypothetical protein